MARQPEADAVAARRREIAAGIAALVTPELVEEHRRAPGGRHSPALALVLAWFRQEPTAGKLAILAAPGPPQAAEPLAAPGPPQAAEPLAAPGYFGILTLSGVPGQPHEAPGVSRFASADDAAHEVFLCRLASIGALPPAVGSATDGEQDG